MNKLKLIITSNGEDTFLFEEYFDEIWCSLEAFLNQFADDSVTYNAVNKQMLYQYVDEIVRHDLSSWLTDKLQEKIDEIVRLKFAKLKDVSGDLLSHMQDTWNFYCNTLDFISQIFFSLERSFLIHTELISIWYVGMCIFRRHMNENLSLQDKLKKEILMYIKNERNDERMKTTLSEEDNTTENSTDSNVYCASCNSIIRTLIHMFLHLKIYKDNFESDFIFSSDEYYRAEGDEMISSLYPTQFTRHIQNRLIQEAERSIKYLCKSTEKKLMDLLRYNLIERHAKMICKKKNILNLINQNNVSELRNTYQLFLQINNLLLFKNNFIECVKIKGKEIMKSITNEEKEEKKELIKDLLIYKDQIDSMLSKSFSNNEQFALKIKDSWEEFLNENALTSKKAARHLAKYCDMILRNPQKQYSDKQANQIIMKVLIIFRYLNAKDFFEEFYRNDLSKRLLLNKSFSEELEKKIIFKLKDECGNQFTNKLESMLNDVDISKEILKNFYKDKESIEELRDSSIEFGIIAICAVGTWPLSPPKEKIIFPPKVERLQNVFEQFYKKIHEGRNLIYLPHIGSCLIKANFFKPTYVDEAGSNENKVSKRAVYDFVVSQIQGICLLLYNDNDSLTLKDIYEATRINMNDLHRQLLALVVNSKTRILFRKAFNKDEKLDALNELDSYSINLNFSSPFTRLHVSQIYLKETTDMSKAEKHIHEDRSHQIDAAIVRLMKSKKKMKHNDLIVQVEKYLKFFEVDFDEFKKRIESLLDREFIEKDTQDPQTYLYIA